MFNALKTKCLHPEPHVILTNLREPQIHEPDCAQARLETDLEQTERRRGLRTGYAKYSRVILELNR